MDEGVTATNKEQRKGRLQCVANVNDECRVRMYKIVVNDGITSRKTAASLRVTTRKQLERYISRLLQRLWRPCLNRPLNDSRNILHRLHLHDSGGRVGGARRSIRAIRFASRHATAAADIPCCCGYKDDGANAAANDDCN